MSKPKISITGIFVQDPNDKGYTGFFSEIPEAVAEGATFDEAVENLFNVLPMVLEVKNKVIEENKLIDGINDNFIRKSFEFELA